MLVCSNCGLRYELIIDVCSYLANGLGVAGEPADVSYCPHCGSDDTEDEEKDDD